MALLPGQAGRILLGCFAIVGIHLIYQYMRIVQIIITVLVLAQLAACVIPLFTSTKFQSGSAIVTEPPSTSELENNFPGSNRAPQRSPSRQEEEIQRHLQRLEMAAVATASTSNEGYHIGPEDTRPTRALRRQGEEIDRHLGRLAMAAAAADAAVANVASSPRHQGERVTMQSSEWTGATLAVNSFTGSNSQKLHRQHQSKHRFESTEQFSRPGSFKNSSTGY